MCLRLSTSLHSFIVASLRLSFCLSLLLVALLVASLVVLLVASLVALLVASLGSLLPVPIWHRQMPVKCHRFEEAFRLLWKVAIPGRFLQVALRCQSKQRAGQISNPM